MRRFLRRGTFEGAMPVFRNERGILQRPEGVPIDELLQEADWRLHKLFVPEMTAEYVDGAIKGKTVIQGKEASEKKGSKAVVAAWNQRVGPLESSGVRYGEDGMTWVHRKLTSGDSGTAYADALYVTAMPNAHAEVGKTLFVGWNPPTNTFREIPSGVVILESLLKTHTGHRTLLNALSFSVNFPNTRPREKIRL